MLRPNRQYSSSRKLLRHFITWKLLCKSFAIGNCCILLNCRIKIYFLSPFFYFFDREIFIGCWFARNVCFEMHPRRLLNRFQRLLNPSISTLKRRSFMNDVTSYVSRWTSSFDRQVRKIHRKIIESPKTLETMQNPFFISKSHCDVIHDHPIKLKWNVWPEKCENSAGSRWNLELKISEVDRRRVKQHLNWKLWVRSQLQ